MCLLSSARGEFPAPDARIAQTRAFHSWRSVEMGSMRMARRAGIQSAKAAAHTDSYPMPPTLDAAGAYATVDRTSGPSSSAFDPNREAYTISGICRGRVRWRKPSRCMMRPA